ncbi:MAG: ABC transporter ATP-binding protein [Planctomycetes bacterium]|nr:ABC transporter ATP-binding protein [Planctomycetota bacterium]
MTTRSFILSHMGRYRGPLLTGIGALVLVDLLDLLPPLVLMAAVDRLQEALGRGASTADPAARRALLWLGAAYLGVVALQGGFRYVWRQGFFATSHRIANDMRRGLYARLQRQELAWFDRARTGDIMSHATNDIEAVRMFYGMGLLLIVDSTAYFLTVPPLMAWLSPGLTLWTLLPLPLLAVAIKVLGAAVHRRFRAIQDHFSLVSARAQEGIAAQRVLKTFARESHEARRFAGLSAEHRGLNLDLARLDSVFQGLFRLFMGVAICIVLWAGGHRVLDGRMSAGSLVAFLEYLSRLVWPMMALGWTINIYQRGMASAARLVELGSRESAIREAPGASPGDPRASVEFRGLRFTYPGAPAEALRGVDLAVPAGATVALVGPVGGGKSTLLALVNRLYDPPPGTVLVGGRDVRDWPLGALRTTVAMVPQETFLFSDTVAANIGYGLDGGAVPERIQAAARDAAIDREVEALPAGYDSLLGERGVNLSGGQRQRVAIARALATRAPTLLLDDCLSSVDTETEGRILDALRRHAAGVTCLMAAHRTSTVRHADLIVVLAAGRVVEQGTHDALVAAGGAYARMVDQERLEAALEVA